MCVIGSSSLGIPGEAATSPSFPCRSGSPRPHEHRRTRRRGSISCHPTGCRGVFSRRASCWNRSSRPTDSTADSVDRQSIVASMADNSITHLPRERRHPVGNHREAAEAKWGRDAVPNQMDENHRKIFSRTEQHFTVVLTIEDRLRVMRQQRPQREERLTGIGAFFAARHGTQR
jgi:hypothetical protein